jgi:bifunctional DNase/RNase
MWSSSRSASGERYLPIWIGPWEASSIAMRLQGLTPERPLTHDLFATTLEQLGANVERVVISELAEETYHARIFLELGGRVVEIDSRPSDALALAVRVSVPVFAAEDVLDQAGLGADGGLGEDGEATGVALETTGEQIVGPTPRRLPRLRQLARRRPRRIGNDPANRVGAGRGLLLEDRLASAEARPRFDHIRRRSNQKSLTARKHDRRLRPGWASRPSAGSAGRRPRPRNVPRPGGLISSSAEKNAPPDSTRRSLERLAPEQLAGTVDVGDSQAEEDPVGQR